MLIRLNNNLPLIIVGSALAVAFFVVAFPVFANSPFDIEFPIPELGNCTDKTACKAYCDSGENLEVCQEFAIKHKLGSNHEEAEDTIKKMEDDGGPGGCAKDAKNPAFACKRYCDNSTHIEECVSYAKEHNLMDGDELKEAEKVVSAIKRGVKLPPQCENAESCKETCENPKDIVTARACFEFGKEAGLLPEGVSSEQAEKAFSALENGKGPFKSFAEMRQCDNPPSDEVMQKCIDFALEAGFIPPEEAETIRKTGGKGPGGCRGKDQCENYCEANREECFNFAKENNLLREEDKERMKEGMSQMQKALADAPPEVLACIREAIPDLDGIIAGEKFASPMIGEKMRGCFDSFFKNRDDSFEGEGEGEGEEGGGFRGPPGGRDGREGGFGGQQGMMNFPPEVKKCLSEKFGEDFLASLGRERPSPDVESKMRECFETMRGDGREDGGQFENPEGGYGDNNKERPCPTMPTVSSCGEGQELIEQQIPGCGVYGRCVFKGDRGGVPSGGDEGRLPPQFDRPPSDNEYGEEYQKQFDKQFQGEFQNQYRQESERQIQEQVERQTQEQYRQGYQNGPIPSGGENYGTPGVPIERAPINDAVTPASFTPPPSGYPSTPTDGDYRPPEGSNQSLPPPPPPTSGTDVPIPPSGADSSAPTSFWFSPSNEQLGNVYSSIKNLRKPKILQDI